MTGAKVESAGHSVRPTFARVSGTDTRKPVKAPPPFSLRLSAEERGRLEQAAGGLPLGTFIKARLFGGDLSPRRIRGQAPVRDHAALAQVLGMLGNMRLASNLNQLAKAVHIGTLPLTPEVEDELVAACADVIAMKAELMRALGYPAESGQ